MILVKVELYSARTGVRTELAKMVIFNDGTGTSNKGNYGVQVFRKGSPHVQRTGVVENHPRLRDSVWSLVKKALISAGY